MRVLNLSVIWAGGYEHLLAHLRVARVSPFPFFFFFFFFSQFVFRAHVTTDKEAVTLQSVICMTGWCDACPLGCCVYSKWLLVNGVGNMVRYDADRPLPFA